MLQSVSYYQILGLPVIAYGGILTLTCLLFTASIAIMNRRGINKIPMSWHFVMARVTIVLALLHGMLGILSYI